MKNNFFSVLLFSFLLLFLFFVLIEAKFFFKEPKEPKPLPEPSLIGKNKKDFPKIPPKSDFKFYEVENVQTINLNETVNGTTVFGGTLFVLSNSSYVVNPQTLLRINLTCESCSYAETLIVYYTNSLTSQYASNCTSYYESCLIPVTCLGSSPGDSLEWYFLVESTAMTADIDFALTVSLVDVQYTTVEVDSSSGSFSLNYNQWSSWESLGSEYRIQFVQLTNLGKVLNLNDELLITPNYYSSYYQIGIRPGEMAFGPLQSSFGYYCPGQYSLNPLSYQGPFYSPPITTNSSNPTWWLAIWTGYYLYNSLTLSYEVVSPMTSAMVKPNGKIYQLELNQPPPAYSVFTVMIESHHELPNHFYYLIVSAESAENAPINYLGNGTQSYLTETIYQSTFVQALYPSENSLNPENPLWQSFMITPDTGYYGTVNVSAVPVPSIPTITIESTSTYVTINTTSPSVYLNFTSGQSLQVSICSQTNIPTFNSMVQAFSCANPSSVCRYCSFSGSTCCQLYLGTYCSCYDKKVPQQVLLSGNIFNAGNPGHEFLVVINN